MIHCINLFLDRSLRFYWHFCRALDERIMFDRKFRTLLDHLGTLVDCIIVHLHKQNLNSHTQLLNQQIWLSTVIVKQKFNHF